MKLVALVVVMSLVLVAAARAEILGVYLDPNPPRAGDRLEITAMGTYPNGCYHQIDSSFQWDDVDPFLGDAHLVMEVADGGACLDIIVDSQVSSVLEDLEPGTYTIEVTEDLVDPRGLRLDRNTQEFMFTVRPLGTPVNSWSAIKALYEPQM